MNPGRLVFPLANFQSNPGKSKNELWWLIKFLYKVNFINCKFILQAIPMFWFLCNKLCLDICVIIYVYFYGISRPLWHILSVFVCKSLSIVSNSGDHNFWDHQLPVWGPFCQVLGLKVFATTLACITKKGHHILPHVLVK